MSKKSKHFREQSTEICLATSQIADRFGLSVIAEKSNAVALTLLFQNEVTGVEFEYSPQDQFGWRGIIGRLSDGKFPVQPIFITPNDTLDSFDLLDVAALRLERIPALAEKLRDHAPMSASDMIHILEICCTDILGGDFSLFSPLRTRVMGRLRSLELR
jgi:hypothetical protein